jgi:hypothetical protein
MKKLNRISILGLTAIVVAGAGFLFLEAAKAEETTGDKIQNKTDDAVRATKKGGRKMKKQVRDATGHHSLKEDLKDESKNAGDAAVDAGKKVKRKVY